jgi:hypothetical protein
MANAPKTRIAVPASAGQVAAGIRHIAIINDQRWRRAGQADAATGGDTTQVSIALQMILILEGVE